MEPISKDAVSTRLKQRLRTEVVNDPHSRRLWRKYRRRASYALGAISAAVREELLEDLDHHVREALSRAGRRGCGPELEFLKTVLGELGPPERFFAPLISISVLARPRPPNAFVAPFQAIAIAAHHGGRAKRSAAAYLLLLVGGAALAAFALGHLFTLTASGALTSGELQSQIFGASASANAHIWAAMLLIHIGGIAIGAALRKLHDLALDLIVGSEPF